MTRMIGNCSILWMHFKKFLLHLIPRALRCRLYEYLIRDGRTRYGVLASWGSVCRTLFGFVIKGNASPSECAATEFVRRNTNIPVPFVYDYINRGDDRAYFVIQHMSGMTLHQYRFDVALPTSEQQAALARQLHIMLDELRSLRSPFGYSICRYDGSPLDDARIQLLGGSFGPFASVEEFQDALLKYSGLEFPDDAIERVAMGKIKNAFAKPRKVVLTHGDLMPVNVLIDNDLNITGIIDWATASWMPDYWEPTKSIFLLQFKKSYWRSIMDQVFSQYEDIHEANDLILQYRQGYA